MTQESRWQNEQRFDFLVTKAANLSQEEARELEQLAKERNQLNLEQERVCNQILISLQNPLDKASMSTKGVSNPQDPPEVNKENLE